MGELLERDSELARIAELIDAAREGGGGMLVIEGPAGIGKTELVEAVRDRAREAGLQLVSARGAELEADFALGVVRQLFEHVLAAATGRDRRTLLAGPAEAALTVLGGREDLPDHDRPSFSVLHGLYQLCANL